MLCNRPLKNRHKFNLVVKIRELIVIKIRSDVRDFLIELKLQGGSI